MKIRKTVCTLALAGALALNMSLCTINVYAENDAAVSSITEEISFGYDRCTPMAADSEGNIYFKGMNKDGKTVIFKADRKGKLIAEASDGISDHVDLSVKLSGDKVVVTYRENNGVNRFSPGGIKCRVYDTDLAAYEEYSSRSWGSDEQLFDASASGFAWFRRSKLYISDNEGKNERVLADLSEKLPKNTSINGIALTEKYAAFSADGNNCDYIGYVDIDTGKVTVRKEDRTFIPRAFSEGIVWYSDVFPEDPEESIYAEHRYFTGTGRICTLTSSGFCVTETESGRESLNGMSMPDSKGRLITMEADSRKYGDNRYCIRIYENGDVIGKFYADNPFAGQKGSGLAGFTADGGAVAVNWCGTSDGNIESLKWVAADSEEAAAEWINAHSYNVVTRTAIIDYSDI